MFRSFVLILGMTAALSSHAQITAIAEAPLNTGGVSIVRPNIVLLLDDSNSMEFQYSPDYLAYGTVAKLCDKGVALVTGGTPGSRVNSAAMNCPLWSYPIFRDGLSSFPVLAPTPPAYSPDVNQQYYNPDIRYTPPVKADLSFYPSMTGTAIMSGGNGSANPDEPNWRAVPLDGFKAYTPNTYNIEKYPSPYYCDTQATPNCAHDTSYNFPEVNTGLNTQKTVRIEPRETGTAVQQDAFTAPYYYRLGVSYYCENEQLTSCINSTVPNATYVYPARLLFCKDTDKAVCQKNFDQASGYILPSYTHAPLVAATVGKGAFTTLNVKSLIGTTGGYISSLSINGINIANTPSPLYLNQGSLGNLTLAIAARINTLTGYSATVSGTNIVIASDLKSASTNGIAVVLDSVPVTTSPTVWTFTLANANNASLTKGQTLDTLSIGATNIAGSPIVNSLVSNTSFSLASVENWATKNGTNGFTATATKSGNNITLVVQRTNVANYVPSDDSSIGNVGSTRAASGTRLTPSINAIRTASVTNKATFSFNGGTIAETANTVLAGGFDPVTVSINRGAWTRVDIMPSQTYPRSFNRTDCASTACTYKEEMTNFANWFAYYRFRMNSTKSATGQAFSKLDEKYRVGYHTLSGSVSSLVIPVDSFDLTDTAPTAHRKKWYDRLYGQKSPGSTPLRSALGNVGRYYGGKMTGADPIEHSCQKNYTILVTDGYWNGAAGRDLNNVDITASLDSDVSNSRSSRESGVFDGQNVGGTLADVAQYYYDIDLRTTGTKSKNNVPVNARDDNSGQHMNTYTMGLGIDGLMTYRKDYITAATGDFSKITSGSTGCSWEASMSTVCNWPKPVNDSPTAVDDLWHAAVNGRGQYFSARTPLEAAEGIKSALSDVTSITGSAAAATTSSPDITITDNLIYSSTYETSFWAGEVVAQRIDPATGAIIPGLEWRASDSINAQADALSANSNARTLLTFDTALNKEKTFKFSELTLTEKAWFSNHCTLSSLAQCADLTILTERRPYADSAENMVNFLTGINDVGAFSESGVPFGYLDIFRNTRGNRLGDTVNAVPLFVYKPMYTFDYTFDAAHSGHDQYSAFIQEVTVTKPRKKMLYMAANDGMLHGLDGNTGVEVFAYAPRTTMPELWRLADQSYGTNHRYFVDGSPVSMDVTDPSSNKWRTIVVGGYGNGGSGYYALDVTDPMKPKALWEVCNSNTLCNKVIPNLGLSFGNPVITRMPIDHPTLGGKWVVLVSSGYNNVPSVNSQPTANAAGPVGATGKGALYVLDPLNGTLLATYNTNEGSTVSPINLGKITTYASNFYFDGISSVAYSGDMKGNIWRFDLAKADSSPRAVRKIATLKNGGVDQPITTRIEVGRPLNAAEPILYVGTGRYVSIDDLSDSSVQSVYALRDPYYTESLEASPATLLPNNIYGSPRSYAARPFVEQKITDESVTVAGIPQVVRKLSKNPVDLVGTDSGWFFDLPDTGERVSLDPSLVLGTLTMSSNVVDAAVANACEVGGYSWLYQVNYQTGSNVETSPLDAAAYKVPNSLLVGTVIIRLPSGVLKIIATTATGDKIPYGLNIDGSGMSGRRVSWRELSQ